MVSAAAVLASVVAAAVGEGETAADVDEATNAKHTQITLVLLTLTGISLRASGNALDLCAHMSCSCEMAAVVAAEEATIRVTKRAIQIDPPTVTSQRTRTLTLPLTQQNKDPRTVAVLAVAPTTPDLWRPVAHVRYKRKIECTAL
jgi:hypothetical protein